MKLPAAKARRGFAAMSPRLQRQIASKGGKAVSLNRKYMARIGRRGGKSTQAAK